MSTPFGHGLAGYALTLFTPAKPSSSRPAEIALVVVMAILPDLDFLPGLLFDRALTFHRGWSHSLGFAVLASAAAAFLWSFFAPRPWRIFLLCLGAVGSHLVLDYLGQDGRPPYGIQILWPFSEEYFLAPWPLFPGVRHTANPEAGLAELVSGVLDLRNLFVLLVEVAVIAPFLALGHLLRLKRRAGKPAEDTFERAAP